jgi:hypothetical protein
MNLFDVPQRNAWRTHVYIYLFVEFHDFLKPAARQRAGGFINDKFLGSQRGSEDALVKDLLSDPISGNWRNGRQSPGGNPLGTPHRPRPAGSARLVERSIWG